MRDVQLTVDKSAACGERTVLCAQPGDQANRSSSVYWSQFSDQRPNEGFEMWQKHRSAETVYFFPNRSTPT